ncbi:GntR family transcriptional regulator [Hoeflea sp. WL0058]|uniref:GntR family transcriptional regulator n=1 Tax=Flavimaribacter sediminis TaxID=2865987 RepID=A0AAE2ZIY6_9HYPH|nr:GntR family transcriptional regulator [Flavimaribacter sediminis]MBW8637564.1 GntR family transcriptional regulator [Flavimaribacter sediminis]
MVSDDSSWEGKAHIERLVPVNLVDQVREELLRLILSGAYSAHERLPEAPIARQLGVSRGPVREAARQLEKRGLLRFQPRRGFFIKRYELADVEGLYQYRECIQIAAARLAVIKMTSADIKDLKARADEAYAATDLAELDLLDLIFNFHRVIFTASGNGRFLQAYDDLVWELRQVHAAVNARDDPAATREFFSAYAPAIIAAFEERDADAVEQSIKQYLQVSLSDVARLLEISQSEGGDARVTAR